MKNLQKIMAIVLAIATVQRMYPIKVTNNTAYKIRFYWHFLGIGGEDESKNVMELAPGQTAYSQTGDGLVQSRYIVKFEEPLYSGNWVEKYNSGTISKGGRRHATVLESYDRAADAYKIDVADALT